uniref:Uncharacterized protein n=1 Tax=Glossina palpalis gambiensis TaxID=67801 RepID=A0A1B0BYA9_9MUSC
MDDNQIYSGVMLPRTNRSQLTPVACNTVRKPRTKHHFKYRAQPAKIRNGSPLHNLRKNKVNQRGIPTIVAREVADRSNNRTISPVAVEGASSRRDKKPSTPVLPFPLQQDRAEDAQLGATTPPSARKGMPDNPRLRTESTQTWPRKSGQSS